MTYKAGKCLVCDGDNLEFRAAVTAPFVAARAFGQVANVCRVAQCRTCGLIFFEDRFDSQETAKLYADYRGETYYRARHHWEPWYTRAFNCGLGGTEEMMNRRQAYAETLNSHGGGMEIDTVLDYGGDRGQLMAGGPGRSHFVYDISGVEPEAGVTGLDAASLAGRTFDLILLCEVLEHVSNPMRVLEDVVSHIGPGGLFYVTVPNQEFPLTDIPTGAWYRRYLRGILKRRWAILLVDFLSTGFRVKFRRVPPLGFVKLHEHINFFVPDSLAIALRRAGLAVLTCEPSRDGKGVVAMCQSLP
jgi:SAM-dependent methyltransferase